MFFIVQSCQKENSQEEAELQSTGLVLKHYSKRDIEKNPKLASRLREFNEKLTENQLAKFSTKSIYNPEYDFTIYTDLATYIENGDYHSYTFPLVQGADEKLTNVLFELNDQGEYDAFLPSRRSRMPPPARPCRTFTSWSVRTR